MNLVLVVDDDPVMIFLIRKYLEGEAYHLLEAGNGSDAQALIEQHANELSAILLDWSMPGISGIEVLRWIKSQARY
ncbi:MAG: response regulator, partial [Ignavibacteriales bacterium]|nr:response regulator [Ignavibacteriales bacterium]